MRNGNISKGKGKDEGGGGDNRDRDTRTSASASNNGNGDTNTTSQMTLSPHRPLSSAAAQQGSKKGGGIFRTPSKKQPKKTIRTKDNNNNNNSNRSLRYVITSPSSTDSTDDPINFKNGPAGAFIRPLPSHDEDEDVVENGLGGTKRCSKQDDEEKPQQRSSALTVCYSVFVLTICSILGESLRVFVADLFGDGCKDSMEDHWLYDIVTAANLCLTSTPSAIFVDLPANMLGCFIMGLLQPSRDLNVVGGPPQNLPWLDSRHSLQSASVLLLGLRTGFCGSLTTLSSWNTQMVMMMYSSTVSSDDGTGTTYIFSSLLGYVIGLETAYLSLKMGQLTSLWMFRRKHPLLAQVEDRRSDNVNLGGHLVNARLPDFERRFLDSLLSPAETEWMAQHPNGYAMDCLARWKQSTQPHRVVRLPVEAQKGGPSPSTRSAAFLRVAMEEMEHQILVPSDGNGDGDGNGVCDEHDLGRVLSDIAYEHEWDLHALFSYAEQDGISSQEFQDLELHLSSKSNNKSMTLGGVRPGCSTSPFVVGAVLTILAVALLAGFAYGAFVNHISFYRSVFLSALMAPPGTLLRWKLSQWNGSLSLHKNKKYAWVPLGTFLANSTACLVSILMASLMLWYKQSDVDIADVTNVSSQALILAIMGAIKTGFAGSLSTVSTLVAEGDKLHHTFRHHAKAIVYMVGTLAVGALLGLMVYLPVALTLT
jgi:fluoride ion exporter CrcB/FEX